MITLHSRVSKQMVNYELGKIYKLVCNKTGLVYVGSTCQRLLSQRLSGHVRSYKHWKKDKTNAYTTSFKIIEGGDYYMELLEAVTCSSFDELAKKERHYIESIDCVNKFIPARKSQEYREVNKEKIKVNKKQYYMDIKEKLSAKVKCSKCSCEVRKDSLLRHQRTLKCQNTADILLEIDEITK